MLLRFTDDTFEEHMASTIGVDFKVKTIRVRRSPPRPRPRGAACGARATHPLNATRTPRVPLPNALAAPPRARRWASSQ